VTLQPHRLIVARFLKQTWRDNYIHFKTLLDIEGVGRAFVWLSTLSLVTSTTLHAIFDRLDRSWRFRYSGGRRDAAAATMSLIFDASTTQWTSTSRRWGKPAALATLAMKKLNWRQDTESLQTVTKLYKMSITGDPETLEDFDIIICAYTHMCTPHKYACNPTCITSFTPISLSISPLSREIDIKNHEW